MRKRISTILIVLFFLVGLSVMLYPTFSEWYNARVNSYVVSNYVEEVDNRTEEEYAAMFEEARAYNDSLTGTISSFVSGEAEGLDYISALNVVDGMMGYLEIEKLDLSLGIYHGTDESVLQRYVGHLEGTQLPTGDVGNNTVLTGHTGLPTAELFTGLTSMELGDTFQVKVLNEVFTYEVFNISVVEPTEVDLLLPIEGKDVVTLVTCTPYGINSHRLLVQGEQIEVEEIQEVVEVIEVSNQSTVEKIINYILDNIIAYRSYVALGGFLLLLLIAFARSIYLRRYKKVLKKVQKEEKKEAKIRRLQEQYIKDEASYLRRVEKRERKEKRKEATRNK